MEYIGYVKYQGPNIKDGLFDARDAATALIGFDEVFRYFLEKEEPEFAKIKYDFPVKIEEGSWGPFTPENIADYITVKNVIGGLAFTTLSVYLTKSAAIAAKEGILNTPAVADVSAAFRKTYQTICWVVKLVSHAKGFRKKYEHIKLSKTAEYFIITNDEGKELEVPVFVLGLMDKCPPTIFGKLASLVNPSQELEIGVKNGNATDVAKISEATRRLFYADEDGAEEILPELKDGETVELTGVISRANEKEQSIGFGYNDHIITCKPIPGKTLADFKTALISQNHRYLYVPQVVITGIVERTTVAGDHKDKPRIFFSNLVPEDTPEDIEPYTPDMFNALGNASIDENI